MIIAVDFDGTIVEHKYPKIGKELPFAIETLLDLKADGHQLILWTAGIIDRYRSNSDLRHIRKFDRFIWAFRIKRSSP